jgi:3-oxoacyl-[acyl-carrier-protein] synthase-3
MVNAFNGLKLKALACALPEQTRKIESFKSTFDAEKVDRFREVVGIEQIHVAPKGLKTSDLACVAAEKLFAENTTITRESIDVLLFITQTPDAIAPATSALLQQRLQLRTSILALDINQGCAGFLIGLQTAAHLLASPAIQNVLILGGDTLTRCVDESDPATAMLFGDAGFAAVIGREADDTWHIQAEVESSSAITIPHQMPFAMDGTAVFNFTITKVPEQIQSVMQAANLQADAIDFLLLHQANAFIVRQVARMCRIPEAKVPCRIANRGNTSVASLPLLLCDLKAEGVTGKHRVVLSAFGVGLTWITIALTLDFDVCNAPILHSPTP